MNTNTFRFIFKNLPWLVVFCLFVLAGIVFPFAATLGGSTGWLLLAGVVIYAMLVAIVMGAEQHRCALRERLAWQAFMQVLHNRDDNGLPGKYQDMREVKRLELEVRHIAVPPNEAKFIYNREQGLIEIKR